MVGEVSGFYHGGSIDYVGAIVFDEVFEDVFDELFPEVAAGIAGQFVGEVADCHYVDAFFDIWGGFLDSMPVNSINGIFEGLISEIDGNGTIGIIRDVGNGLNDEIIGCYIFLFE